MNQPPVLRFEAVIIDPEMATRMRLKQMCASVVNFGKVTPTGTFNEGLQKCNGDQRIDVVFMANRLGQEGVADFVKQAKASTHGQDAAYILVLSANNSDGGTIAQSMMIGADGVLFEPFSVDQLVEITGLAARVRKERSGAREEAALRFLLQDIMTQINLIAFSKSCGFETGTAVKHFKQVCSVLSTLEGESIERYNRLCVDMFEEAPMPKELLARKKYGGSSSRVKKKMAEKINAEVEKLGSQPKA